MEKPKEDSPVFLDRAARATRGKRMNTLLNEEVEEDELFWNQEALKEEENDENYEEEPEVADEFDSDFEDDEPEPDDEEEKETEEREKPKKRLIFPGKTLPKKMKKKKVPLKSETIPDDETQGQSVHDEQEEQEPNEGHDDVEGERVVRKSTRTSVIVRQAERDAIRAALQATMKPIKRKKEGEEKRMTQEEMLLEAAQTEIINLRNLERVLAREEEVKKKAIVHKAVYNGPKIRYFSKDGCNYLEFCNGASFQSDVSTKVVPYPEKAVCVVTGLPAKYRDPKTGLPYASREAFKVIRERFMTESACKRKQMDMGDLFNTLCGKGFMVKQKRSETPNKSEMSFSRRLARFRRFQSPESEDSD